VLRVTEIDTPVPERDEVLVQVRAVSVNASDYEGLTGKPMYSRIGGLWRPRHPVLGSDVAGRVEAVGPDVTEFASGADVFGDLLSLMGGFAEYVCVPAKLLAPMPPGMSHEEASCLPQAGAIALQGMRTVTPGQDVLINGGGGGTGTYAIQLAKMRGATVTAVDNAEKLDYVRSLGADEVIDYRQTDFTRTGKAYDLILDLAGYRSPRAYRRALKPGGRYLFVGGSVRTLLGILLLGGKRVRLLVVKLGVAHAMPMAQLCLSGDVTTHIDRRFTLAEVPEALRYHGDGHARGKVVITVGPA
jgi:NADPH:quinone reductase-like Zn-dependent oxidoreductase